jgi:N-acetylneuraminic acid mutarotase
MKLSTFFGWVLLGCMTFLSTARADYFITNSSMILPRANYAVTRLLDGRVLVTGGNNNTNSCELYDPVTGSWRLTTPMNDGRAYHTVTLLTNGNVLVTGGQYLTSCEIFNPVTETWTYTSPLPISLYSHTAQLLTDGRVMVVSGYSYSTREFVSYLYSPASETWSSYISTAANQFRQTVTRLANGKILMAGGWMDQNIFNTAQLFDPVTATWSRTGTLNAYRYDHAAVGLPDGRALVVGGVTGPIDHIPGTNMSATVEVFNPVSGTWAYTGSINTKRHYPTLTLLPNGKVLLAGGLDDSSQPVTNTEVYDPAFGTWSISVSNAPVTSPTPILLANGRVMFPGSPTLLYDSANNIVLPPPTKMSDGSRRFTFTAPPNGTNVLIAATNLFLPAESWNTIGAASEISSGVYQASDLQATNFPQRFYRIRTP